MRSIFTAIVISLTGVGPAMSERICHIAVKDPTADNPSLNLRTGPGASYGIIGDMENGEHISILNDSDGRWIYVYSPGLGSKGWIAAQTASGRPYIGGCFNSGGRDPYGNR